ncbi:MAG: 16S rRNA (cytosine(1402)-N(4))-methyltransferase RsmH [Gammaproteobacteria bacterium]|nr:16S rRNA (cytosine(1402)-N(4))-methyltransferase RsmH [Gammaproteobacteria bacterium]
MHDLHQPVLLAEVLAALRVRPEGIYLDGTFGRGGHSRAILAGLGPRGRLLAMDRDPDAVAAGMRIEDRRFVIERGSFADMGDMLQNHGVQGAVDGILLDLGVSSPQLDDAARGFSFQHDGPLDMRMDPERGEPASAWLARIGAEELADVLWRLGEERYSRRIARAVVAARDLAPIETTARLASVVAGAVPRREPGKHPATRTFQAIRIHINRELDALRQGLEAAVPALAPSGRLAVISFHSLEDRIVKRFLRDRSRPVDDLPPDLPVRGAPPAAELHLVGKPRRPGSDEVAANPRARSAVLRVAERLGA